MSDHELTDLLTVIAMDYNINFGDLDTNQVTLRIVQHNLLSICRATIEITEDLTRFDDYNVVGLVKGLIELSQWIEQNADLKERNGT